MKKIVFALTCYLLQSIQPVTAASEISPGVLYPSGTELQVSTLGISFRVPQNWQAMLPQGSEVLIMEPTDAVARIIVSALPASNAQTIEQLMSQSQMLDAMSQLQPSGQLKRDQGLLQRDYEIVGSNPQNLQATAYARLGDNQTAVFVILLHAQGQSGISQTGRQFIRSVQFGEVKSEAQVLAEASNNMDWNQALKGRTLKYMRTENGLSIQKNMNLCSDGTFAYSDNDSYISNDAMSSFSASSNSDNYGRWQIQGNQLLLQWNDGSRSQFTLSRRYVEEWSEWGTFVDDERWFNVQNQVCM